MLAASARAAVDETAIPEGGAVFLPPPPPSLPAIAPQVSPLQPAASFIVDRSAGIRSSFQTSDIELSEAWDPNRDIA